MRWGHSLVASALILLVGARGTASAQYQIDTWTTEHGLPQASVFGIAQTPDGFLWATTFGGLVRFDGVNFRVFDTVTNPELPTSRLGAPLVDDAGYLWIVTEDRVLLRFRHDRFQVMGTADGLPERLIRRFGRDRGRLRAETSKGHVILENGRVVPDTRPGPPASAGLTRIGQSAGEALWYVDRAGLAHRYEGGRLTRTRSLPLGRADLIYEDRAGRLWMRDIPTGDLICVVGDTVRRYGTKDGVVSINTLWIMEDADGTLWLAQAGGLVVFRDGRFRTFTKNDGLPDSYVNSVFRDREGTHWVATQGGLARFTEQPIVSYSTEHGLTANNTYPILKDRRGDIWIGAWPGLTRYRNGAFEDVTAASEVANRNVLSLMEDRDGSIWVGMYGGGVSRLRVGEDGRITSMLVPGATALTYAIYQGRGPDIWFGADRGAVRYHDGVFEPVLPGIGSVSTFYEDDRGTLWIGHAAGLARYARGVVTPVGEKEGFSGRRVRMIHPDANGALWFGTYDTGLFRYRDGVFTQFTTREGLPANGAFQILEDEHARFWISSNAGIYRVARSELDDVAAGRRRTVTAVRYGRADGMANQECNGMGRPAGVRANDGRFWFPTQGGVAVVDPKALGSLSPPPVAILDVMVGGFPVASRDRIEIRSGSTSFLAQYAALTFVRPELAQFKYRMDGLDPDWVEAGTDRTARYAHLPYGDFRFRVIAANRDGVWNEEGASIAVVVVPPFYRTTWFMVLMFLGAAGAGVGVHRVRLGVIERRRALQEAFARQLIDSQETDRKRIASELHDGVSQTLVVIRNWARIGQPALPDDSATKRRLGEIADAASQAIGEVREVVQDLVPYHLERLGLVEAIRDAAARVGDASGIPITCRLAALDGQLSSETALRLFRVMQEGLNNVVKHSGATSASLDLTVDPTHVRLTIRDNGKGFVPDAVTPTAVGDGFGLVGMTERTRMMGGDLTIESAPGRGTTITIVVPMAGTP